MNRNVLIALAAAAALLAVGCDTLDPEPDYYPTTVGSTWRFAGSVVLAETDGDTVGTMVIRSEVIGTATLAVGGEAAMVQNVDSTRYQMGDDITIVTWDTTYMLKRDNRLLCFESTDDTDPDTILVLPVEQGRSWVVWSDAGEKVEATVVGREDATVPAGTFRNCWKVKQEYIGPDPEEPEMHYWLADGVGPVRHLMQMVTPEMTVTADILLTDYDVK